MACRNRRRADDNIDCDSTPKRQRIETVTVTLNGSRKTATPSATVTTNSDHNEPVEINDDDDDDDVIIIGSQEDDGPKEAVSSVSVKVENVKTEKLDSPRTVAEADNDIKDESSLQTVPVKSDPVDNGSDKEQQISELKQQLKESEDRYMLLQSNVRSLLQIIVPDLRVPALSFVNDIVVEMIKVNCRQAGRDDSDGGDGDK